MSERVRRRVTVRGRVQGVFFRGSVRRAAASRGVSGWIANRADGSVEAVFEGEPDAVRALVRFCSDGPRGAQVEDLDEREEPVEGLSGFEVC